MPESMSPELRDFIEAEIEAGRYASIEDMQLAGLELLKRERDDAVAGINEGIASIERGNGLPLNEAFAELRRKHNVPDDT